MYHIYKVASNTVVDFAAEELKKYLRMMMPRCGDITIDYKPDATEGFRLGLMADFGLSTAAETQEPELDDIVHIDTDENGGIIAGSNYRSVLLAVYEYLKKNGCRWLFPGVDGEFIPMQNIVPVQYHKMADCRYRGQCNEGAESQQVMLESIDFTPKVGLNCYMIEFDIPKIYYDWYYSHRFNDENREPEPVSETTVLQWKRVCEVEFAKRGIQMHDMGHGWNAEPFGISSTGGWNKDDENPVPEETRQYLAELNGVRGLYNGIALNTQFCMSNPKARKIVIDYICNYAKTATNVDLLAISLADGQKGHCECAECRKKRPSDWYVIMLNELDEAMTAQNLPSRIKFSAYSDTAYEPLEEEIRNPSRFVFTFAPITRSYTYSAPIHPRVEKLTPYVRNVSGRLGTLEESMHRFDLWREKAKCYENYVYEYYFWKHQFYAPGVLSFANRIREDVFAYRDNDFKGMVVDGSQRCYFPNAFSFYVYGAMLFDNSLTLEELIEDYFSHAYGDQWQIVVEFLKEIDRLMPQTYLEALHTAPVPTNFYKPEMEAQLLCVEEVAKKYAAVFDAHKNMPYRVQTVAMRLMRQHTDFCTGYAKFMAIKCLGKDDEAREQAAEFLKEFGKRELAMEHYYDHFMATNALNAIVNTKSEFDQ
ncbi:MAG: DUF4838 domain-containing protein [Oscillospiraceae bacterium]|nr:DUF4838 domain-containing protein [Oscillospiraceae bacterium]